MNFAAVDSLYLRLNLARALPSLSTHSLEPSVRPAKKPRSLSVVTNFRKSFWSSVSGSQLPPCSSFPAPAAGVPCFGLTAAPVLVFPCACRRGDDDTSFEAASAAPGGFGPSALADPDSTCTPVRKMTGNVSGFIDSSCCETFGWSSENPKVSASHCVATSRLSICSSDRLPDLITDWRYSKIA